jgi:hypothetical protein
MPSCTDFKETFINAKGVLYNTLTDFGVLAKQIGLKVKRGVKLNIGFL